MKLSNFDNRNFGYVLSKDDRLETVVFVGDTLKEVATFLGITEGAVSRLYTRKVAKHIKNHYKIERVQLYDYVYMLYEEDIYHPISVALDIKTLAQKSGKSKHSIIQTIYSKSQQSKKYAVTCIDLFEYEDDYAKYIRECLKIDKVTQSYANYLETSEELTWK